MNDELVVKTKIPQSKVLKNAPLQAPANDLGGKFFALMTGLATLIIIAMLVIIVGNVVVNGYSRITLEFLTEAPRMGMTEGGIFPAIFGTVALVLLMTIAVVPVGIATAVFLHEYTKPSSWPAKIIRMAVANLAGVPSIVFGLFGLGFFVNFLGGGIDRVIYNNELHFGQPALIWAALTLAILTMPVVIVTVEEALRAVPREIREASLALGATKWETIWRVVIPRAFPGILSGAILAVSRGAGEVAPIIFTGAAYFLPFLPTKLNDQFMELGYHIYVMATQSPDVEATKPLLYATVLVLLGLTFLLNMVAIVIRARMRKQYRAVS